MLRISHHFTKKIETDKPEISGKNAFLHGKMQREENMQKRPPQKSRMQKSGLNTFQNFGKIPFRSFLIFLKIQ